MEKKIKALTKELKVMVIARGSTLMDLRGVGPVVAARTCRRRRHRPVRRPEPVRVLDRHAPLDASSGEQDRHRLSRAGNRRMNHMIHIAAVSQIRLNTDGRVYYRRKRRGQEAARGAQVPQAQDLRRALSPARDRRSCR
ncbi:transposase [Terrabacter sp. 2TAF16]|uniref:transposase n=1 Tax=Terrabacter sp. 2TAF16 TaxID=3233008 RepID=UPI003F9B1A8E